MPSMRSMVNHTLLQKKSLLLTALTGSKKKQRKPKKRIPQLKPSNCWVRSTASTWNKKNKLSISRSNPHKKTRSQSLKMSSTFKSRRMRKKNHKRCLQPSKSKPLSMCPKQGKLSKKWSSRTIKSWRKSLLSCTWRWTHCSSKWSRKRTFKLPLSRQLHGRSNKCFLRWSRNKLKRLSPPFCKDNKSFWSSKSSSHWYLRLSSISKDCKNLPPLKTMSWTLGNSCLKSRSESWFRRSSKRSW